MYNSSAFRNTDHETLRQFIQAHPLGLLITHSKEGLQASNVPFLIQPHDGKHGVLRTHVAKANSIWQTLEPNTECLIVFQGPQGYVTPNWYANKAANHKVVPTWNYATVQCRGVSRVIHEATWLKQLLSDLTNRHEQQRDKPWKVSDAPAEFVEKQISSIVGIEISIQHMEGKFKMSQNRQEEDRMGVIRGFSDPADAHHNPEVAAWMKSNSNNEKN